MENESILLMYNAVINKADNMKQMESLFFIKLAEKKFEEFLNAKIKLTSWMLIFTPPGKKHCIMNLQNLISGIW